MDFISHRPLEQLDTALNITGAGGQTVPYLGIVRVSVKLPEEIVGVASELETLAVVCPDTKMSARLPIIIGTNTLRALAKAGEHRRWAVLAHRTSNPL